MEPRPAYLKRTTSFGLECCKPVCLFSEGLKAFRPGLSGDGLSIEVVSHPHPAGHCGGTVVEVVHGWSFGDVAETDRAYDEGEVDRLSWLENGVRGFDAEFEDVALCDTGRSISLFGPHSRSATMQLLHRCCCCSQSRNSGTHCLLVKRKD